MDDEPQPFDSAMNQVAAAQAQLEVARRSGQVGAIALAQTQLAATLAAIGDHQAAVTEFREVVRYLDLAQGDDERETQRWLRMTSPAAPPPDPSDIDPQQLQALVRIHLAESLLILGQRDQAKTELDLAAPACRGIGRGPLKRRLADVRGRMTAAAQPPDRPDRPDRPQAATAAPGLAEQVAAADELLGLGRFNEAARLALAVIARCQESDLATRARARQVLGMALDGMGQPDDAQAVLNESFSDYIHADDPASAVNLAVPLAWRLADAGDRRAGIELLRSALAAIEDRGGQALRVQLLTDLGSMQDQDGRPSDARQSLEGAVATAESLGVQELLANAQHGLAIVLAARGNDPNDSVEALSMLDECRSLYDSMAMPDRAAGCEHEAAALLGRLGSFDAAKMRYERAMARYEALPEPLRDTGSWPDEVADVRTNIDALAKAAEGPIPLVGDPRLFRSGGHAMNHGYSGRSH